MRYIAAEDVAKAKEMDLLTYLRNYEPQELVCVSGNTYCTRAHDSLRISNGKWCWFSQGIGGRSALDYLIKVKGIPFTQAAEIILGREAEKPPVFYRQKERRHTELLMPELSETTERVEKYLQGRGIHPVIIRYCLDNRLLFESADFHNAVFVGHDKDGKQYIRSRDAETPFQVMSYSTMTFQESEIYGEDVLEDTECNVEESVMQRMDIERVRTALKMLAPEERAIIQDFFFTESPIPVKELVEKYGMPKTSIYRKRDDALKKLKKILGNA